ncbi:hypothetical protein [Pseudoalteromonas umbrosa]|uniref:hypothetical protein n=1 Tax=Pseudoalteromonas umbrosa TaxID=3048489 RepID=UPI0024C2FE8B|nr:hypothetical protein [Pseudoalteromonas sp. B95]MDK1286797.1 hypothetical protein [Pseudoalteromonas sp. B95]
MNIVLTVWKAMIIALFGSFSLLLSSVIVEFGFMRLTSYYDERLKLPFHMLLINYEYQLAVIFTLYAIGCLMAWASLKIVNIKKAVLIASFIGIVLGVVTSILEALPNDPYGVRLVVFLCGPVVMIIVPFLSIKLLGKKV